VRLLNKIILGFFLFCSLNLASLSEKDKKTELNLRVLALPFKRELYLSNWDLENNFTNLKQNDRIIAESKEKIYLDQQRVIPAGLKFYGFISGIEEPKNFNRDGKIKISFYAIEDLKGNIFRFQTQNQISSTDSSLVKKTSKIGQASIGGSLSGGLIAYQAGTSFLSFFLSPQFLLTGAAGLSGTGFLIGFLSSATSKGKKAFLKPGDDLLLSLENSLIFPATQSYSLQNNLKQEKQKEDLNPRIEILKQLLVKDEFKQSVLILDLKINNQSNFLLSGNNFYLSNNYKSQIASVSGVGLKESYFYKDLSTRRIKSGEIVKGQLAFELDMPGIEHFLRVKNYYQQKLIFAQSIGYPKNYQEKSKFARFRENLKSNFKR